MPVVQRDCGSEYNMGKWNLPTNEEYACIFSVIQIAVCIKSWKDEPGRLGWCTIVICGHTKLALFSVSVAFWWRVCTMVKSCNQKDVAYLYGKDCFTTFKAHHTVVLG